MSGVYLISSERSGTNLIRREITNSQKKYYGMSPAHFLKNLYFQEPYYGDLSIDKNFRSFISDAIDLCTIHFSPWDINWSTTDIISDYKNRTRNTIVFADYMMTRYAKTKGYESYFCKDNFLYEFALIIEKELPEAKFIYLYRDPRDVCLSQIKRAKSKKSLNISTRHFAKMWSYEQNRSIRCAYELDKKNKCFIISYESFLETPQDIVKEICIFIKASYEPQANDYSDNFDKIHEWKNLSKPVQNNNTHKYLTELSKRDILLIEEECTKPMEYLGYKRETISPKSLILPRLIDTLIMLFHILKSILKKNLKSKSKPDSLSERSTILKKMVLNYTQRG